MAEGGNRSRSAGQASIKAEYIDHNHKPKIAEQFLPKTITDELKSGSTDAGEVPTDGAEGMEPPQKRPKLKGRHKKRPIEKNPLAKDKICPRVLEEKECPFGEKCKFNHNITEYLASKPPDVGEKCYVFDTYGRCPYSYACCFASSHVSSENKNLVNEELYGLKKQQGTVRNVLDKAVQKMLWKRTYDFKKADEAYNAVKQLTAVKPGQKTAAEAAELGDKKQVNLLSVNCDSAVKEHSAADIEKNSTSSNHPAVLSDIDCKQNNGDSRSVHDCSSSDNSAAAPPSGAATELLYDTRRCGTQLPGAKSRDADIKQIDFRDKLYLAPLTTVGNLPFRRICKGLGADITCGEMSMCTNLLQGQLSEWALLKRHESEDLFGIQVCGAFPDTMMKCAQLICETYDVDFIDINCGCPIDLVFKKGEGCALMSRPARFEQIVKGLTSIMDVPLTVKMRTGIYEDKSTAHTLLPRLRDWGVSMVTIHGRSREQRYTRLADWEYINECAKVSSPMPLFGNGDILSYEDYVEHREQTGIAGVMIARGALIKPWLFTEIKEQRHWDISATERLDMMKDFANFGLEHWGSDQQGVSTTRRFLLEWLSFLYRYIPVGILERLPQRINEKPPYYFGRSDLETLLASPNCADWVKITEMLLGPVRPDFVFLPKHKANAYN